MKSSMVTHQIIATLINAPKGWAFSYPNAKCLGAIRLLKRTAYSEITYAITSDNKWKASAMIAIEWARAPPTIYIVMKTKEIIAIFLSFETTIWSD